MTKIEFFVMFFRSSIMLMQFEKIITTFYDVFTNNSRNRTELLLSSFESYTTNPQNWKKHRTQIRKT